MTGLRTLLIGYGNPARGDDGLGPEFARRIAEKALPALSVEVDYQLTADHALTISGYDTVVFADAVVAGHDPFVFCRITGEATQTIGSHSVTPDTAVALSTLLFKVKPLAFTLGLGGQRFEEIKEGFSARALVSLDAAENFFVDWYLSSRQRSAE